MKYTTVINNAGVVNSGLHHKTDLNDWAILDYIKDWQSHPKSERRGNLVWINYSHLLAEMPLLAVKHKSGVANRIKKLKEFGLLETEQCLTTSRLFAGLTLECHKIMTFTASPCFQPAKPKKKPPLPVHTDEHPVHTDEHPVHTGEHPVHTDEHITVNQLTVNQETHKENEAKASSMSVGEVVDLYHEILPSLPSVLKVTDARRKAISARIHDDLKTPSEWRVFFSRVGKSDFLTGKADNFRADLEWLCKPSNFLKVREGRYDPKNATSATTERSSGINNPPPPRYLN